MSPSVGKPASVAFNSEADMLAPISANAGKFLTPARRRSGFKVFYELIVGHGIADVVVIQFDERAVQDRLRDDQGPVEDHLQMRTLLAVQTRVQRLADLAEGLRVSPDYLRRAVLPRLWRAGGYHDLTLRNGRRLRRSNQS